MPLYQNILGPRRKNDGGKSDESAKSNSNLSMKLLQDHLNSKRRHINNNNHSKVQHRHSNDRSQEYKSGLIISESNLHKPSENDWDPEEEYDPLMPNSYELLQAQYLKSKEFRSLSGRKSSPSSTRIDKRAIPDPFEILDQLEDDQVNQDGKKMRGTAIAPPPSLLASSTSNETEGEESVKVSISKPSMPEQRLDGSSVAAKIMSKMGYKAGQGLGKDDQGMSSPLEVEKVGVGVGRILAAQKTTPKLASTEQVVEAVMMPTTTPVSTSSMSELLRDSTRVILLQNMVGPGEVDEELEAETKEECKKYGEVVKCLIYEIPNKKVADDEAVRIFVEFREVESAIKAATDLNGRYFGGRVVRVSFYNVGRFNKYELGPDSKLT